MVVMVLAVGFTKRVALLLIGMFAMIRVLIVRKTFLLARCNIEEVLSSCEVESKAELGSFLRACGRWSGSDFPL